MKTASATITTITTLASLATLAWAVHEFWVKPLREEVKDQAAVIKRLSDENLTLRRDMEGHASTDTDNAQQTELLDEKDARIEELEGMVRQLELARMAGETSTDTQAGRTPTRPVSTTSSLPEERLDNSMPAPPPIQESWEEFGFTFVNDSDMDVGLAMYGTGDAYAGTSMPHVSAHRALFVALPGQGKYGVRVLRVGVDTNGFQYWTKWNFVVPAEGNKKPEYRLSTVGKVSRTK